MSLLKPDRYFNRLSSIDIKRDILGCGFFFVLLDVDNTLRSRADGCIPRDIRDWVARAKDAGISIVLFSNSWHTSTKEYGRDLHLPVVMRALKPTPFGVVCALRTLNKSGVRTGSTGNIYPFNIDEKANTKNTLIIGDQVFTDVLCAHLCNMTSYLVAPLSKVNIKSSAWQRALEGRVLQGQTPEGACFSDGER